MSKTLIFIGTLFYLLLFNNINSLNPMPPYDYDNAWKQVDQFESKQLPQSALKVVDEIYQAAKQENNSGQFIKAIIHQLKFVDYKEENAFIKNLDRLKNEAETATFPAKPILHSMLAEMYWQYYQNNRYRFLKRSETLEFDDSEIETWSLVKIVKETQNQYSQSLAFAEQSKKEAISDFEEIYVRGNDLGMKYQSTLFDFLANRAVKFYESQEPGLTKPDYFFTLDREEYLAEANAFTKLQLSTKDELSMKFKALKIYQDLTKFHLDDDDPGALTDLELKRLKFVKSHLTLPNANTLYRKSLESLEKQVINHPVSGLVTLQLAETYRESAALYKPLNSDEHKWDLKKAVKLCDLAIERFPESDGANACYNLKQEINSKSISATIEEQNVPDKPFRALVKYQNINQLYYRIIKTDRNSVDSLREKLEKKYDIDREEEFIKYFVAQTPVQSGNYQLESDGDYQMHGVEVKLDALAAGEYMVLFSHDQGFVTDKNGMAYAFTVISDISYIHRNSKKGETEFYVLSRSTGEPISCVNLKVMAKEWNYKKRKNTIINIDKLTTDEEGFAKLKYINKSNRSNFFVDFSKGDDFISTQSVDSYRSWGGELSQWFQNEYDKDLQTFFFLDRAIYRPGQTIYFKGLIIDPDKKKPRIRTFYKTTIKLMDVNYQQQGSVEVTTNEFGSFSGSFTAPANGLTGQMHLTNDDGSGDTYFRVEEYKRPKFYVGFNPVEGEFKLNEEINVEGFATAYSGAQIDGAKVQYRVVRRANFPFWWWCFRGYYPSSPEMEISSGATQTDENGKFKVAFNALPDLSVDPESDPTFTYTVYADVTDINGETHSSSTFTAVGYKSLRVGVTIGNIDQDELKSDQVFPIQTVSQSGQFLPANGTIKIYQLKMPDKAFRKRLWEQADRTLYSKEEYYELFPNDQYQDEANQYRWERGKEVFTTNFDTEVERSFQIKGLKSWKSGLYVLEIRSKDKEGNEVKEQSYFEVMSGTEKKIAIPTVSYYQAGKLTAEPGETASFYIGTSEKHVQLLYELEHDGVIVEKKWLKLKNEKTKIDIPVIESYRGDVIAHYAFVRDNRLYARQVTLSVPYSNKKLDVSFETFRDKLQPGEKEQWKIIVKGKNAEQKAAEMVATLYDKSLDEFNANSFYASFYGYNNSVLGWQSQNGFTVDNLTTYTDEWNWYEKRSVETPYYPYFNWFGYNYYSTDRRLFATASVARSSGMRKKSAAAPMEITESLDVEEMAMVEEDSFGMIGEGDAASAKNEDVKEQTTDQTADETDFSNVKVRTNFNETAFFYPNLKTNEKGEIVIDFTIPEALTTWKMLGFAHTKDLQSGYAYNELVTQKELMVVPNQPRFFRENDQMIFSAKISSLVDKGLSGNAQLEFFDALTMKPVDDLMKNEQKNQSFELKPKQSTNLEWAIEIPEGLQAITYRIVAKAENFSDGEEMTLPVVTNRMLVTESLPLPIRGKQTKEFRFDKLADNQSETLRNHRYTLEFTSNPAWYAIQSLPYLMEYPYDCIEQTFSKFYANSMATHIANSNPKIKRVFDTWRDIQPDALLSNLEKNQELKSALLEETPWVLNAKDESQRKRNVGLLFDLNNMSLKLKKSLNKLIKAQTSNGGFSWFPGMPEDRYMTQYVITGMGHLDHLGVQSLRDDNRTWQMITKGIAFLDREIKEDHDRLLRLEKQGKIKMSERHLSNVHFQYLYMRSFFKDVKMTPTIKTAFDYYLGQAKTYWTDNALSVQGMACLALHRFGEQSATADMIRSFNERALESDEFGKYWKNERGYFWYQAPIETQALMIEVYEEVAKDKKAVESLKVWLLKQKQTQDWGTTKATVKACYALLLNGSDALASSELVAVTVGDEQIDPTKRDDTKVEAGTGYFKTAWQAGEITENMGTIKVEKKDDGVAWGAVYWQYFEQLDKITPAKTPLKIKKDLFIQKNTDRGPVITPVDDQSAFQIGDLVKVRLEIRVDRNMEYVHLKDMRAAAFEPVSTLSTSKYQDGLYYYESPRDLATNFFMGYLPKGTYVFEYDLRASQKGDFSNGITTIQCMYAPEFTSHSQGIRVKVE
ncbi:MAG: alpha-2-macroglobulin family protein [Bacteroidota bacterium]